MNEHCMVAYHMVSAPLDSRIVNDGVHIGLDNAVPVCTWEEDAKELTPIGERVNQALVNTQSLAIWTGDAEGEEFGP